MSYKVMDISRYNIVNDWTAVANEIDGVLIRCGYRGYSNGSLTIDPSFIDHINGAVGANIPVGVYFFTQAINEIEGREEARYVLDLIKDYNISFPIFIDSENSSSSDHSGRADQISNEDRTAAIKGFCDEIISNGFFAGVYASDSWFRSKLNQSDLREYYFWVAKYSTTSPQYVTDYCGWQYTSSGTITGVDGNCDLSHWYIEIGESSEENPTDPVYYPIYRGNSGSIINALAAIGCQDTSYTYRSKIAKTNNITGYTGTAAQNISMLNLLKSGQLIDPDKGETLLEDIESPIITVLKNTCNIIEFSVIDNLEVLSVKDNNIELGILSSYIINGNTGDIHEIIAEDVNGNISSKAITINDHDYISELISPTCENGGYTHHICIICNDSYDDNHIEPLGHNYELTKTVNATCTEVGYNVYTCKNCGDSYTENTDDALGHDYSITEVIDPTCENGGYTKHTCSRCGDTYNDNYVDILDHEYEVKRIIEPTCITEGYTIYSCKNCSVNKKENYVDPLGHNYELSETVEATCTTDGYNTYTCSRCGDTYKQITKNALGHNMDNPVFEWNESYSECIAKFKCITCGEEIELYANIRSDSTSQTCTSPGKLEYIASVEYNGVIYTDKIITDFEALGHNYELDTNIPPTCTKDGYNLYRCTRCGSFRREELPKLGHNYQILQKVPPTCINRGYTRYSCLRCSDIYDEDIIEPLGHDIEETRVEPTCIDAGTITRKCKRCEETTVEMIPALGHHYILIDGIDATYNTQGYGTYRCDNCGDEYTTLIDIKDFTSGCEVELLNADLYPTPLSDFVQCTKSGKFYCWYDRVENDRVKVARREINCGVAGLITGWIKTYDVGRIIQGEEGARFRQGDAIHVLMTAMYETPSSKNIISIKTGLYYIAGYKSINYRVPIVDSEDKVGHESEILGWIPLDSITIFEK